MIIQSIEKIKDILPEFKKYRCVVIICKYNGGKSSVAAELIHSFFGEKDTYYVTFVDQSKPNFTPRMSRLQFNEVVKDKIVVFDEIKDEKDRDINNYLKKLINNNLVVILSSSYGSSTNAEREIDLFKKCENDLLPDNTLFVFVKKK